MFFLVIWQIRKVLQKYSWNYSKLKNVEIISFYTYKLFSACQALEAIKDLIILSNDYTYLYLIYIYHIYHKTKKNTKKLTISSIVEFECFSRKIFRTITRLEILNMNICMPFLILSQHDVSSSTKEEISKFSLECLHLILLMGKIFNISKHERNRIDRLQPKYCALLEFHLIFSEDIFLLKQQTLT